MRFTRRMMVLAAVLACTPSAWSDPASEGGTPPPPRIQGQDSLALVVTGMYRSVRDPGTEVWIASLGRGVLQVRCGKACYSVGFWDGRRYRGVLRPSFDVGSEPTTEPEGDLRFEAVAKDTLRASIRFDAAAPPATDTWIRRAAAPGDGGPEPESPPDPGIGDYVYVEELPEVLTRAEVVYPEEARRRRIQGTVIVQALVGRDGRVKETKVLKGVPELDATAEAVVRQWVFAPAKAHGAPVAVWVAVPVKFALH